MPFQVFTGFPVPCNIQWPQIRRPCWRCGREGLEWPVVNLSGHQGAGTSHFLFKTKPKLTVPIFPVLYTLFPCLCFAMLTFGGENEGESMARAWCGHPALVTLTSCNLEPDWMSCSCLTTPNGSYPPAAAKSPHGDDSLHPRRPSRGPAGGPAAWVLWCRKESRKWGGGGQVRHQGATNVTGR